VSKLRGSHHYTYTPRAANDERPATPTTKIDFKEDLEVLEELDALAAYRGWSRAETARRVMRNYFFNDGV